MSTQTATIYVQNAAPSGAVDITLWHRRGKQMQSQTWTFMSPGATTPTPLQVSFDPSDGGTDAWSVKYVVHNGSRQGVYQSGGSDNWTGAQLTSSAAGQTITFTVDASTLTMPIPSNSKSTAMRQVLPASGGQIDNVFVLMLENHSFDNIFAFSGIPGIQAATTSDSNSYGGSTFHAHSPAPLSMPTDPGHEFVDTLVQLCGPPTTKPPSASWEHYQEPITNGGFVYDYANSTSEAPWWDPDQKPSASQLADIMAGFDTPSQLPIIYTLATNFAVCDAWHSSLPGPTWPNRFFVHGASSAGWTASPGLTDIIGWNYFDGFTYPSGSSIYDKLNKQSLGWRIYNDEHGATSGAIPQVLSLKGVGDDDIQPFTHFAADVQGPYPYAYTFIEPNYGDTALGTYEDGSSQHPMDSMGRGEALIKATYEAIRRSPLWERSLLIITYDEHGGFYDSVAPQGAPPPNDGSPLDPSINKTGFPFNLYGVRVPAV
ncbi:MAG: alkaline phosphatase family protein, partial [Caulobacter sp.]